MLVVKVGCVVMTRSTFCFVTFVLQYVKCESVNKNNSDFEVVSLLFVSLRLNITILIYNGYFMA